MRIHTFFLSISCTKTAMRVFYSPCRIDSYFLSLFAVFFKYFLFLLLLNWSLRSYLRISPMNTVCFGHTQPLRPSPPDLPNMSYLPNFMFLFFFNNPLDTLLLSVCSRVWGNLLEHLLVAIPQRKMSPSPPAVIC